MTRYTRLDATAAAPAVTDPVEAALALRASGRLEEALDLLGRAGGQAHSQDVWNLRGDLRFELGRIDEAAQSYGEALRAGPGNMHALGNLALCHYRLNQWEAAAGAFRDVLALESHRDDARLGLGGCLLHLNRAEEALACFAQCWSQAARARAEFGKASALQLLRRFDQAEAAYERALAADPKLGEALSNLVAMSMEVFDLSRTHRYALRLLEILPQSTVALQALTLVALERREFEEAAYYFGRFLEHAPEAAIAGDEPGGAIEYRLSQEVVARLNQMQGHRFAAGRRIVRSRPAGPRLGEGDAGWRQ